MRRTARGSTRSPTRTRLKISSYTYFDIEAQSVRFFRMMDALACADAGGVVVLQGCCNNPAGADLGLDQWNPVAAVVEARGPRAARRYRLPGSFARQEQR